MTFYRQYSKVFTDQIQFDETASLKVFTWLSSSDDSGVDFDDQMHSLSENNHEIDNKLDQLTINEPQETLVNQLSEHIRNQILKLQGSLENVPWEVKDCDTLLQVDKTLFPIQRQFVACVSGFFRKLVDRMDEKHNNTIVLNGFQPEEIRTVLTFIYSVNEGGVTDANVASLLQLAKQFRVKRILRMCEKHLVESPTFNRVIALRLSQQYALDDVFRDSCIKLSQVVAFEDTAEFLTLDYPTQNIVMRYALKRFQQAQDVIRYLDVYLCGHHGNDSKNNECCFRSATYRTEESRTFLVKVEKPEERLMHFYREAFDKQPRAKWS